LPCSGAVTGDACAVAAVVAAANGAVLTACRLDGLIATVDVAFPYAALQAQASARAGPPR
jgi:hypothetical protein